MDIDPRIKEWATERQSEVVDAVLDRGVMGAARHLGVSAGTIHNLVKRLKAKAAAAGFSPDHDLLKPVAPGYVARGHSTLYTPNKTTGEMEVRAQWVKTRADEQARAALIESAYIAAAEILPRLPPLPKQAATLSALVNLFTITDFHLGMAAWAPEGGAHWDIPTAEATLIAAFEDLVSRAPAARRAIVNIQGDFLHTDGAEPVTPSHHHVLDAAGRYAQMVDAAIRALRRLVDVALMHHDDVVVIFAEGNHDLAGSMWLRKMFAALYEREARVEVNDSELPFYVEQWGKVMIGVHHGHKVKNEQLPGIFAAQFAEMWGATTKRYAHCGHRHHADEKEYAGMTVVQHPTLAARDAYAARGGWIADRAATCITYHESYGQVARTIVSPEMLETIKPVVLSFRGGAHTRPDVK